MQKIYDICLDHHVDINNNHQSSFHSQMQKTQNLLSQTVAGFVTGHVMNQLSAISIKRTCGIPKIRQTQVQSNIKQNLVNSLKSTAIDAIIQNVIPAPNYSKPIRALPNIVGDSLISIALETIVDLVIKREMPNLKQIQLQVINDVVKNTVYYEGKARTTYSRIINNAAWGFAAGASAELLESKIQKRKSSMVQKGCLTAVGKVTYGEIYSLVMNGEVW